MFDLFDVRFLKRGDRGLVAYHFSDENLCSCIHEIIVVINVYKRFCFIFPCLVVLYAVESPITRRQTE